jgi:serine O-acetyltransferase
VTLGGAAITVHPPTREFPASEAPAGPRPEARPGARSGRRPRISFGELRRLLAEDHAANDRSRMKWTVSTPGFQAIAVHRLGVWCNGLGPALLRAPVRLAVGFLAFLVRTLYGIELHPTARVGRRLRIAHQHGIVIHPAAVIGDDCLIRQGVTIGGADDGAQAPRLGDRVKLGVGAVLAGPITIGDDVVIGPNAVVMVDVPARSIVTAPPARIMTPPPRRAPAGEEPPPMSPER